MTKTMLFYPYTRAGVAKVTKSQLDVYLKEYDKVPPDLLFYTEQKTQPHQRLLMSIASLKRLLHRQKKNKLSQDYTR